jgi:hypothetical protein
MPEEEVLSRSGRPAVDKGDLQKIRPNSKAIKPLDAGRESTEWGLPPKDAPSD